MFKSIAWVAAWLLCLVVGLLIIAAFLMGLLWLADRLLPWANLLAMIGLVLLPLFLLLALVPKLRGFAGGGIVFVSYTWGVALWLYATLTLYDFWGTTGLFIGLVLLGVGTLPLCLLAQLFHGQFKLLFINIGFFVLIVVIRLVGNAIKDSYRRRQFQESATADYWADEPPRPSKNECSSEWLHSGDCDQRSR